jgi:hypothetical protein
MAPIRRGRSDGHTGDLFQLPQRPIALPGSMDFRSCVSEMISVMLAVASKAGMDRHEVAARASRLSGKDVTKNMLDGYTAPAREEFNCPLWLAPVLETVCASTDLCNWHATVHGGQVLVGAAQLDAEIGRLMREREQADAQLRNLKEIRRRAS